MDKNAFLILTSEIETQMALIDRSIETLEDRATGLQADDAVHLESVAYQIHNYYNTVEDLLKLVAGHFENRIADTARWHIELLRRMTQAIPGIRLRGRGGL